MDVRTLHPATGFNPRTRVGCDGVIQRTSALCFHVSIHAPAWGATFAMSSPRYSTRVSIHAPAWGATSEASAAHHQYPCFNPRTRVGCDPRRGVGQRAACRFQSTHPRGVRLDRLRQLGHTVMVSIHAPAWGATHLRCRVAAQGRVSIHAPAWGATKAKRTRRRDRRRFNPRTRVGCDRFHVLSSRFP